MTPRPMRRAILAAALLALAAARPAAAQDPAEGAAQTDADIAALLRQKGCHACHALDEAQLGPPWRAIAALHASRRDVMADVLAQKIIEGGAGNWGVAPMVANPDVTPEQARAMAVWILNRTGG